MGTIFYGLPAVLHAVVTHRGTNSTEMTFGVVYHSLHSRLDKRPFGPHGFLQNQGATGIRRLCLLHYGGLVAEVFSPLEGKLRRQPLVPS